MQYALDHGNSVNDRNQHLDTALSRACLIGSKGAIDLLIEANADVNVRNAQQDTPLHNAVRSGREEIVQRLLDAKANANLKNNLGSSPLDEAREFNYKSLEAIMSSPVQNALVSELASVLKNSPLRNPRRRAERKPSRDDISIIIDAPKSEHSFRRSKSPPPRLMQTQTPPRP